MGRVPRLSKFDRSCQEKSIKLPMLECSSRNIAPKGGVSEINDQIRLTSLNSGADYFDLNDVVCNETYCLGYIGNSNLYYDTSHWSVDGSISVGNEMVSSGRIPLPLKQILTQTNVSQSLSQ